MQSIVRSNPGEGESPRTPMFGICGSSTSPQPSKSELRSSRPREERGEGEVINRRCCLNLNSSRSNSNRNRPRTTNSRTAGIPPSGVSRMDWNWFLFRFEGRINRAKYWLAGLIILCWMSFALMLLDRIGMAFGIGGHRLAIDIFGISASLEPASDAPTSTAEWFPSGITIPMTVLFAWCYAATSIKRLHDRDKSGWRLVPFIVFPGLFGRFGDRLGDLPGG